MGKTTDLIVVPVLELKINLAGTAIAKWVLTKIVSATDHPWPGLKQGKRLTLCSEGPTPMTKTLPPNLTDCQRVELAFANSKMSIK